jgi:hypothetical protein
MPKTRRRQSSRSSQKPNTYSKKYSKTTKRNTNKSKHSKLRNKSRKLKRNGGNKSTKSYTSYRQQPYSNQKQQQHNHPFQGSFSELLDHCKSLEDRPKCRYDPNCKRTNPQHFQQFSHPSLMFKEFKPCVDKFIRMSHELYIGNNQSFPNKWYSTIQKIKETDYTKFDTFYFNILANLCLHSAEYTEIYDDKLFWNKLFMGMEEQSVTGMYDITSIPALQQCLKDIGSPDTRYLSNTALLFSKPYKMPVITITNQ